MPNLNKILLYGSLIGAGYLTYSYAKDEGYSPIDSGSSSSDSGSSSRSSKIGSGIPPNGAQVLVMNLSSPPVDVKLNGKWYKIKGYNDSKMVGKPFTGRIINLGTALRHFELKPEQIKKPGLNLWGFGHYHFKVLKKPSECNLRAPTWSKSGGINYWAHSEGGKLVSALGFNSTINRDPHFYKNFFSSTTMLNSPFKGKVAIFLSGYGKNHPGG